MAARTGPGSFTSLGGLNKFNRTWLRAGGGGSADTASQLPAAAGWESLLRALSAGCESPLRDLPASCCLGTCTATGSAWALLAAAQVSETPEALRRPAAAVCVHAGSHRGLCKASRLETRQAVSQPANPTPAQHVLDALQAGQACVQGLAQSQGHPCCRSSRPRALPVQQRTGLRAFAAAACALVSAVPAAVRPAFSFASCMPPAAQDSAHACAPAGGVWPGLGRLTACAQTAQARLRRRPSPRLLLSHWRAVTWVPAHNTLSAQLTSQSSLAALSHHWPDDSQQH